MSSWSPLSVLEQLVWFCLGSVERWGMGQKLRGLVECDCSSEICHEVSCPRLDSCEQVCPSVRQRWQKTSVKVLHTLAGSSKTQRASMKAEVCGSYRLAWHGSSTITMSPQPHPFVEGALAHPLKSIVQKLNVGSLVEMHLRLADQTSSTCQACRVSVRLQGSYDGGRETAKVRENKFEN